MSNVRLPKSPYQKYGKSPFVYSPTYQNWKRVAKENGARSKSAIELACHHARMMRVKAEICENETSALLPDTNEAFALDSVS